MPRGSRIAPAQRRSWLEAYEWGDRIDKIAREAGRTERTVQTHIARARQEKQQQEVTSGLLREAYQRHFSQLLDLVKQLAQASNEANPGGLLAAADLETRMLHQGLRAHIPSSRLWTGVKAWEQYSKRLATESESVRGSIEHLVEEEGPAFPEILAEGFAGSLWSGLMMHAEGREASLLEYKVDSTGGSLQLRWGSFVLADQLPTQARAAQVKERHEALAGQLLIPDWVSRLMTLVERWKVARDTIEEEAAALRLRYILPGQCSLCPGGEGTAGRRRLRSRRDDG